MRSGYPMRGVIALSTIAMFVVAGCGTGDATAPPGDTAEPTGMAGGIEVALQEWAVLPASSSASTGETTFVVTNDGPEDVHEFVIVRTDLDPGALPTDETGAVVETGEGILVVDEIEDMEIGATEELTVTLDPGSYVLLCNIYDEEENEAHYQLGMRTAFQVEG